MKVRNIYSKIEYPYQFITWDKDVQNKDCYEVLDWGDLVMGIQIMADSSRNDWKVFDRDHIIRIIASNPHRYVYRELDETDWIALRGTVASSTIPTHDSKVLPPEKGIEIFDSNEDTSCQKGKDYLLVIGIDNYTHFKQLSNAVKDVQDTVELLTSTYGFHLETPFTTLLLNENATRRNIIKQLELLCDTKPNDRVIIFYSGHGHLNQKTKHGFWIPVDAEVDDVSSYLPNSIIRDYIKAMPCRHILLVSDSCFSGDLLLRNANDYKTGAIMEWERLKSRWIFCSGKGVVSDGMPSENSPFATQILRCLKEQGSEPLNIARLADDVTRKVRFNYEQQAEASPLYGVGHDGGQFIFYPQIKGEKKIHEEVKIDVPKDKIIGISDEPKTMEKPILTFDYDKGKNQYSCTNIGKGSALNIVIINKFSESDSMYDKAVYCFSLPPNGSMLIHWLNGTAEFVVLYEDILHNEHGVRLMNNTLEIGRKSDLKKWGIKKEAGKIIEVFKQSISHHYPIYDAPVVSSAN